MQFKPKILIFDLVFLFLLLANYFQKIPFLVFLFTLVGTFYFNFKISFILKSIFSNLLFIFIFEKGIFGIILSFLFFLLHIFYWSQNFDILKIFTFFGLSFSGINLVEFLIFIFIFLILEKEKIFNLLFSSFILGQTFFVFNFLRLDKFLTFFTLIGLYEFLKYSYGKINLQTNK